jgi:hypothetical protein
VKIGTRSILLRCHLRRNGKTLIKIDEKLRLQDLLIPVWRSFFFDDCPENQPAE